MSNYKKRSQSLMDELSDNLKRTIKKVHDIENEGDLSIIQSENEESKSNPLYESNKFEREKNYERNYEKERDRDRHNNLLKETKKVIENNPKNYLTNSYDNYSSSPITNYKPNSINGKANKLLENLDNFSSTINKDFLEVEDMIENMLEKELKSLYK